MNTLCPPQGMHKTFGETIQNSTPRTRNRGPPAYSIRTEDFINFWLSAIIASLLYEILCRPAHLDGAENEEGFTVLGSWTGCCGMGSFFLALGRLILWDISIRLQTIKRLLRYFATRILSIWGFLGRFSEVLVEQIIMSSQVRKFVESMRILLFEYYF